MSRTGRVFMLGESELLEASSARTEWKQNRQAAVQRPQGRQAQPGQPKVLQSKLVLKGVHHCAWLSK